MALHRRMLLALAVVGGLPPLQPVRAEDLKVLETGPAANAGTFTQQLYDEAKKGGWSVISMKNDWKRIFAWDP
jgi:hypothetical protein